MNDVILSVRDLRVEFDTYGGIVKAVRGVTFDVPRGKTLAIVGESGCGKSVTVQAVMGLIPIPPGRISQGSALLDGKEILGISEKQKSKIRGQDIGMIFQDPMTSLNPTMTTGRQIAETVVVHQGLSWETALNKAAALLDLTRIPDAKQRLSEYPFQFSGGMIQRVMIAMALACEPKLLIADEPTTALDVTIQAQILELMYELQQEKGMSIILITHDLGVVARMAHEVAVMYAGQIVERGEVDEVFYRPSHPYTLGLQAAMPRIEQDKTRKLVPIEGAPPDLFMPPAGCGYFARCPFAMKLCEEEFPPVFDVGNSHGSRCWLQYTGAPGVQSLHQKPTTKELTQ
jgi:oligopeptide/dipeptide ABC transporter ATP-binding protein